jgi:hypothetical protein
MILLNSSQVDLLVDPNMISSTLIWHTNKPFAMVLVKSVGSTFPTFEAISDKEIS